MESVTMSLEKFEKYRHMENFLNSNDDSIFILLETMNPFESKFVYKSTNEAINRVIKIKDTEMDYLLSKHKEELKKVKTKHYFIGFFVCLCLFYVAYILSHLFL
jgi:hypothetical protein